MRSWHHGFRNLNSERLNDKNIVVNHTYRYAISTPTRSTNTGVVLLKIQRRSTILLQRSSIYFLVISIYFDGIIVF